jgi:hypothetical protein
MKISLRIDFADGSTKDVVCSAPDFVAFEDRFNLSITRLDKEMKFTHLLFLGWTASHRMKATALDFESWVDTVDSVGATGSPK